MAYLVKTLSLLERVSLLVNATACFPPRGGKAFIGESLFFLRENKEGGNKGPESVDGGSFILNYTVGGGHLELWPKIDLRPFVLTQASLNPLLPTYLRV